MTERRPTCEGTFPSELVKVRVRGEPRTLFLKYGVGADNAAHGHRGGVAYEAHVYRALLQGAGFSTPGYVGAVDDPQTRSTWLVLEALEGCERLHLAVDTDGAMARAAGWLGRFHAAHEGRPVPAGFRVYDAPYYLGWVRRALEYAGPLRDRFPWFGDVCAAYPEFVELLLGGPQTVVHGEFYPKNILVRGEAVHPVDWESAARGAGEIDLVSLTEGWPRRTALPCERAYREARWPGGPPAGADRAAEAARMYLHFRWLGDRPGWTGRGTNWHFKQLRTQGKRLGVIA